MAEKLKEMFFTRESIERFAAALKELYPEFDSDKFFSLIYDDEWEKRELKDKMRHTARCLRPVLPESYSEALEILKKAAPQVKGFEALSLPEYVALYGINDWDLSLPALIHFTRYSTSEMAVRPFLVKDLDRVMKMMLELAEDKDHNVRRFASEGCRPRLPWSRGVPQLKKDPSPILPVLEKLKNDESEFVRRSVANNLNDISKDHPETALEVCERWYGTSEETDSIVKHACRGLLKAGNPRALRLFGFGDPEHLQIKNLILDPQAPFIGDKMKISFELHNPGPEENKVRLEYRIQFIKPSGRPSQKVFQITETQYSPGIYSVTRSHSFADMSTRKHHPGSHAIAIIVNGIEKECREFELKRPK